MAQIDQEVLARKLKECIAKFPVKVRHLGREFLARLNATFDITQVLDGGTVDDMAISIIAGKDDFAERPPKSFDDFDVLISGKWITFQVKSVPDYFDPLSPSYWINLQSPHKGNE